ncbi:hypothetical protein AVEN_112406-1, partial [Araneus ventricosus]
MGHSTQNHQLRALRYPTVPTSIRLLRFPLEQKGLIPPLLRICTGRISAFMALKSKWSAWTTREVGNKNFSPTQLNSLWIFASTTGFGVERSACKCPVLHSFTK